MEDDELSFDKAEYAEADAGEMSCQACDTKLSSEYFTIDGNATCTPCTGQHRSSQQGSIMKALVLGSLAGAVGAGIYYAVRTITGYDLGLITIVVGVIVGLAVRMGAGGSTSFFYRVLAIGLAWMAMCATYVPMTYAALMADNEGVVEGLVVVVAFALSLAAPAFFVMEGELMSIIIFGIGLWEAWRLSAPRAFAVAGPFEVPGIKSLVPPTEAQLELGGSAP